MAGTHQQQQEGGLSDDFFEQILAVPPGYDGTEVGSNSHSNIPMMLQLGSGSGYQPLGLNLEQTSFEVQANNNDHNNNNALSSTSGINNHMTNLFPAFGHLQPHPPPPQPRPQLHQAFHSQPTQGTMAAAPHPPGIRPRVRARRGQATDPHSIAERLRRERIAERMRALQALVPSCNKSDRAAMLDEIVDYVKFLRLQVKVLSMSRLGAAGAVAQLVSDVPLSTSVEGNESGKWVTNDEGTEEQVAKMMEQDDVGGAMQFLQSKSLCIMPISLASTIFQSYQQGQGDPSVIIKPESNTPS
ncbi:hypothetical protein ACFE04_022247 [Oxalis oulophora]